MELLLAALVVTVASILGGMFVVDAAYKHPLG